MFELLKGLPYAYKSHHETEGHFFVRIVLDCRPHLAG